jgi:hypothetical protein
MAVRAIRRISSTAQLRNALPSAIDIGFDDAGLKFKDASGVVQAILGSATPPVSAIANLALTQLLHAGRTVVANKVDGITFTLPAATGSGAKYRIIVGTSLTSGSLVVQVANATDFFRGFALLANDTDGSASNFETANTGTVATESDTATLNRTTTGLGTIGDTLEFEDIGVAKWFVQIRAQASGTEATPFTAAV